MGIIARLKGEEPSFLEELPHIFKGKGHLGEYLTEYALEHGKLGDVKVFSNVIVPRSSGPTTTSEIDVLMLHKKGVFVFESKNYSGWIFGSVNQQNWTVTLNTNAKEHFYNPLKQNCSHIKALANYLNLDSSLFRSYIVFSERCELKKVPEDTASYSICRRHHLLNTIRKDLDQRENVFDDAQFALLAAKVKELSASSTTEAREEHVEETVRVTSGEICPMCGSKLVERNGKYGVFVGCSAFPKCRYTRDL